MSDLVVIAFPGDPEGADIAAEHLERLGDAGTITPDDAVLIHVDAAGRLHLRQAFPLTTENVIDGALLGGTVGFFLTVPFGAVGPLAWLVAVIGGSVVGAATSAYLGRHDDYGIPDEFVEHLGEALAPDSSALFIMVPSEQAAETASSFEDLGGQVTRACLAPECEATLRRAMSAARERSAGAQ